MSRKPFPKEPLRAAFRSLPDNDVANEPREPKFTYVPPSHAKALQLDSTIVEGIRGAGKSHWWAALNRPEHRKFVSSVFPDTKIEEGLRSSQGFGLNVDPAEAPTKRVLKELTGKGYEPRHIWEAVLASQVRFPNPFPVGETLWEPKVSWVRDNAEEFEKMIYRAGEDLARNGQKHAILFDALDRLADDWPGIRPLARSLFQLALDMLANQGIRLKLFVRPDMLADREILNFPDASKLIARKAPLTWQRRDLYALLFQCLANADEGGEDFRSHCESEFGIRFTGAVAPPPIRSDENLQKEIFHALAGAAMASGRLGHKRGFPYTWLPNHLADSHGQVSPRSFFAALRSAVANEPPHEWQHALDFKGIQSGVQEASRVRVQEISTEDYPWVDVLLRALKGLNVPCAESEVLAYWDERETLAGLRATLESSPETAVKLLPPRINEGARGVLQDLRELGVIDRLSDGRIQMPDIYRIAFGLGRKGGVKPVK